MYTVGGYSVLGWNHPGFGGSTVSSVGRFFFLCHKIGLQCMCCILYCCVLELEQINSSVENTSMWKF